MESLVLSFVTALTDTGHSNGGTEKVSIIVPRPRAYLADLLRKALQGRENLEIIVDRRHGERRIQQHPVAEERRHVERRRPKEELSQVVIEGIVGPETPGPP